MKSILKIIDTTSVQGYSGKWIKIDVGLIVSHSIQPPSSLPKSLLGGSALFSCSSFSFLHTLAMTEPFKI